MYNDYEKNKSVRAEDFNGRSRLTSNRDESVSNFGLELYYMPPLGTCSRTRTRGGLMGKEALAGEIQEEEISGLLTEGSARRRQVALCWMFSGCPLLCSPMLGV